MSRIIRYLFYSILNILDDFTREKLGPNWSSEESHTEKIMGIPGVAGGDAIHE